MEHSSSAIDHLVESSNVINQTGEETKTMNSMIQHSSKLLSKYDRRETTDKILIFFSFMFFFACCVYVLKKRAGVPFGWLLAWIWWISNRYSVHSWHEKAFKLLENWLFFTYSACPRFFFPWLKQKGYVLYIFKPSKSHCLTFFSDSLIKFSRLMQPCLHLKPM